MSRDDGHNCFMNESDTPDDLPNQERELLRIVFRSGVDSVHDGPISDDLRNQTRKPVSNGRHVDMVAALKKHSKVLFETEATIIGGVPISPYRVR